MTKATKKFRRGEKAQKRTADEQKTTTERKRERGHEEQKSEKEIKFKLQVIYRGDKYAMNEEDHKKKPETDGSKLPTEALTEPEDDTGIRAGSEAGTETSGAGPTGIASQQRLEQIEKNNEISYTQLESIRQIIHGRDTDEASQFLMSGREGGRPGSNSDRG